MKPVKKKVSVVIPCRNEVHHIARCVEAILSSDYPQLEVLVVDGMSDDGTREVLEGLTQKYENVKIVDNVHQLTPYAFNLGVKNASGDYVQIVGSRNTMAPDYMSKLVQALEEHPEVACVGGDYQHVFETDASRWISYAMESRFGMGGSNYRVQRENTYVDTVGVPMYRKGIFEEIGYFDERLTRNQDDEFNFRVRKRGLKILYCHNAKVLYLVRGSLAKAFQQFFQYGYFKVFVSKKHKELTTLRQLVPFFFVSFLIFGALLSMALPLFAYFYLGVFALYLVVGFFAAGEFTSNLIDRLRIQRATFAIHLGYGLGYLRGVVDFLLFNRKPSLKLQRQTT